MDCGYYFISSCQFPRKDRKPRWKVRKAESMGMTTVDPLEVPEKKMRRADGVLLVESEADSANETAATPRPSNWAI